MRLLQVLLCALAVSLAWVGCSSDNSPVVDAGADAGGDTDSDADADSDSDADADAGDDLVCTGATYDGDYEVSTAEDLAGIEGYATITGTLEVSCLDCPDLSRLACMESVGASLYLNDNVGLTSFAGLEGLSGEIPGLLTIRNNGQLLDLSALDGITHVTDSLWITNNGSMDTCEAIDFRDGLTLVGEACIQDNLPDTCDDDTTGC